MNYEKIAATAQKVAQLLAKDQVTLCDVRRVFNEAERYLTVTCPTEHTQDSA